MLVFSQIMFCHNPMHAKENMFSILTTLDKDAWLTFL